MTPEDIEYVKNLLRKGSTQWRGRSECLRRARRRVLIGKTRAGKPKYKLHWQCAKCKDWFKDVGSLEVDHIIEIGPFTGDWNLFIEKVFCGQENLQCLCTTCHLKKTNKFASARSQWKRNPRS